MTCKGSGTLSSVSDLSVLNKSAACPICHKKVKITIPDKMHENRARFAKHDLKQDQKAP